MKKPIFKILYTEFCLRRMKAHAVKCGYLYRFMNYDKSLEELQKEEPGAGSLSEIISRGSYNWKVARQAVLADKWCTRSLKYWDEIEPYV